MNKSEIQERIEKVESELATLKADLAKCEDGIEQEKCWHSINHAGEVISMQANTKGGISGFWLSHYRTAYMPECRQVTEEDVLKLCGLFSSLKDAANKAHKLGFRMKVQS